MSPPKKFWVHISASVPSQVLETDPLITRRAFHALVTNVPGWEGISPINMDEDGRLEIETASLDDMIDRLNGIFGGAQGSMFVRRARPDEIPAPASNKDPLYQHIIIEPNVKHHPAMRVTHQSTAGTTPS